MFVWWIECVKYLIILQNIFYRAYDCATKFIFKTIPGGERVNAFSEFESAVGSSYTDNTYRFNFKLYVR